MAYKRISAIPTAEGGTGIISPTAHKLIVGAGTSAMTQIAVGTSGQFLGANTSADPSWQSTVPNTSIAGAGLRNGTITNVTGDGTAYTVIYGTQEFNQASFFTGSGIFTAPVAGNYLICITVSIHGMTSSHTQCNLILHATARDYQIANCNPFACYNATSGEFTMTGSIIIAMSASDTVSSTLTVSGGTKVISLTSAKSNFSGALIC